MNWILLSVGIKFRAARWRDMKQVVLFENVLKGSVEIFLIIFETVTSKGSQRDY